MKSSILPCVQTCQASIQNSETIKSDFTIITSGANSLISNLSSNSIKWKSCQNLYFLTSERVITKNLIGLSSISKSLINNIYYSKKIDHTENYLLSVTIIKKHQLSDSVLIEAVKKELIEIFGIHKTEFLKLYNIKKALPDLNKLQYEMQPSETQILPGIFLAGDEQLNGSLNAAMISGEKAALAIIESMAQGVIPIATNHTGPKEIITKDVGFLCDEGEITTVISERIKINYFDKNMSDKAKEKAKFYREESIAQRWQIILN